MAALPIPCLRLDIVARGKPSVRYSEECMLPFSECVITPNEHGLLGRARLAYWVGRYVGCCRLVFGGVAIGPCRRLRPQSLHIRLRRCRISSGLTAPVCAGLSRRRLCRCRSCGWCAGVLPPRSWSMALLTRTHRPTPIAMMAMMPTMKMKAMSLRSIIAA